MYPYAMIRVDELVVYPVKGLGGVSMDSWPVERRGLSGDRRWMLIDETNTFLSQRNTPRMCLYRPRLVGKRFVIDAPDGESITLPDATTGNRIIANVWQSQCEAELVSDEADAWFSRQLGKECRLAYMPEDSVRPANPDYTLPGDLVSFAVGFPVLVASQASLGDLNSRLEEALPMNRFRPNIIVSGCGPFEEDEWQGFTLAGVRFRPAKKCGRCQVTATNQDTAEVGVEPLRTLATFRRDGNAVYFGNYFVPEICGVVRVGDEVNL